MRAGWSLQKAQGAKAQLPNPNAGETATAVTHDMQGQGDGQARIWNDQFVAENIGK